MKRLLLFSFFIIGLLSVTGQTVETVSSDGDVIQTKQSISQVVAYPNPFNVQTTITFFSEYSQEIYFELKNVLGKRVYRIKYNASEGHNTIELTRDNLPMGMYIYSLQSDTEIISKRLVIK